MTSYFRDDCWAEAFRADAAPLVGSEATHERTLDFVPLVELVKFAVRKAGA